MLQSFYNSLYLIVCLLLAVAVVAALIRSITAKNIISRYIGINMLTTCILAVICVLTLLFKENYLPDIALIYSLLSCIAAILLSKIYINLFKKNNKGGKE